ncbi:MAG: riboflavin synthase [Campylobacteraceae bacterium 4484_166]|nr:MAG: riboflavin synthase [Campylobacteraceae bacterium 4484_166]
MFTGLITTKAVVNSFVNNTINIKANIDTKIGDSIAINGVCLTVTALFKDGFEVKVSQESLENIAVENFKGMVHIEQAMRLSDRLDGHIVQGHIDCIGVIKEIKKVGTSRDFYIKIPKNKIKFLSKKGSIAVDGISLTINDIDKNSGIFRLTIILHTFENTKFATYKIGERVNIETDMFARYIYSLLENKDESKLTWQNVENILSRY